MRKIKLTLTLTMLALSSCATLPTTTPTTTPPASNQVQRLRSHPQYETALLSAPEWCRDALTTINNLELALKTAETK